MVFAIFFSAILACCATSDTLGGFVITMHPGEYLAMCYVAPLNIQQTALAKRLHVSKSAVCRLLSGDADLSPEMAVRLSYVFPLSAEAWMEMQTQHSLKLARESLNPANFEPFPADVFADDVEPERALPELA
jgi:addiction module HigA family antidote